MGFNYGQDMASCGETGNGTKILREPVPVEFSKLGQFEDKKSEYDSPLMVL